MLRPSTIIKESTFYNSSKEETRSGGHSSKEETKIGEVTIAKTDEIRQSGSTEATSDGHISLSTTGNETAKAPETVIDRTSYGKANDQTLASNSRAKTVSDNVNLSR